jgi:polysaccharide biosynthesis/export protein
VLLVCSLLALMSSAGAQTPAAGDRANEPLLQLGIGDQVNVQVDGQPEMSSKMYVADDGTVTIALLGPVRVAGLSPSTASQHIEHALREHQFLIKPHVTITLIESRSQRVSVLGEVKTPGRFPVESTTSMLDLLAAAGGTTSDAADTVYVIRSDDRGTPTRLAVDLKGLVDPSRPLPEIRLRSGDTVVVPRAPEFYILGEVQAPNKYRLEPGMSVMQAIAKGGGVTPRGTANRIDIDRKTANGAVTTVSARPTDPVQPGDVIRIKERIF